MKINLEKLALCKQPLKKLGGVDLGSPAVNFKLMGIYSSVEAETEKYIELQKKIIEKYRSKEEKEEIIIPFDSVESFNCEMLQAGALEIELDWEIISCGIEMLAGFTANDMQALNGVFINIKGE